MVKLIWWRLCSEGCASARPHSSKDASSPFWGRAAAFAKVRPDREAHPPERRCRQTGSSVWVEHFTKYTTLYPVSDHTAETMASSLFQHFCKFGIYDQLISDPGSDLMSNTVTLLNQYFGIQKLVSLVDRHESNGVEPTNKQILRHLSALVHDERNSSSWSDPTVLPLIEHFLNSAIHSETGLSPLEAKFGSSAIPYFNFPASTTPANIASSPFLTRLKDRKSVV